MSSFWSVWVIALTIITIIGTLWLLFANRKTTQIKKNGVPQKTGHEYDGIEEYDNALPAWWMYLFVLTIIFGVGYLVIYPGLGNFPGLLKWTQLKQHEQEVAAADAQFSTIYHAFSDQTIEGLAANPQAVQMGQRLFANNCATCHGSDAGGTKGYPNLRDTEWLWGGTADAIKLSITAGRRAMMPAWGAVLGEDKVMAVAKFVKAMSQGQQDGPSAAEGKTVFSTFCIACHGANGEGNTALGAPKLADEIWLYGGSIDTLAESVRNGRQGVMPAHAELLSEERIQLLSAYVYSLSQPAQRNP